MMFPPIPDGRPDGIVFFGTPATAARCLELFLASGRHVDLVVTAGPKRRGRGAALVKTPVHVLADERNIPVVHQLRDVLPYLSSRGGNWLGVVVAYGRMIPGELLARLPLVNLHFSLLPRWRGAAPVERAILAGDKEVGVCVMRLVEGLDEGPVYGQVVLPVSAGDDAESLRDRLSVLGTTELLRLLDEGWGTPTPQTGESSYARKIAKEERRITWSDPAEHVAHIIYINNTYGELEGERLKVARVHIADGDADYRPWAVGEIRLVDRAVVVQCGSGRLVLEVVQPAGRSVMTAAAWWNGVASTLRTTRFDS